MNTSNNLPEIIGLGGTFAAGKDTLAEVLAKNYNYTHISTSDMVRAAARERYGNIERPTLQKTGAELRVEGGSGVLAKRALELPRPLIISGIRTAGEIEVIKQAGGVMIFIDADPKLRYERMRARQRDNETRLTFDEFLAKEKKEIEGSVANADQNIGAVRELADIVVDNSDTKEEFVNSAVAQLTKTSS
jgi:dephospho-CoA kinase